MYARTINARQGAELARVRRVGRPPLARPAPFASLARGGVRIWLFGLAVAVALVCTPCAGQIPPPQGDDVDLVDPATDQAIARGLAFLASRQQPDGSFGTGSEQYRGNVAVAGLCGLAFLAEGSTPNEGPHGAEVAAIVGYLLEQAQPSGLIVYAPGAAQRGPMYGHGFATLFLAECYGMSEREDLRQKLEAAVALIVRTQNAEGGWRYRPRREDADISVTAAQVMALRAARNAGMYVPNTTIDKAVKYVKACQNPDGGFMYMLPSGASAFPRSAGGLAALQCAGIYEGDAVQAAYAFIERCAPRPGAAASQSYFYYGHYYAGQVFWIRGGRAWERWYRTVRQELIRLQQDDGSWCSPISPDYATACSLIVLQLPNGYLPIFRR